MTDPYALVHNERRRERYATDPDYRDRLLNEQRVTRPRQNERRRDRYRADPEYRQRCIEHARAQHAKKDTKVNLPARIDRKSHRENEGKRCPAHRAWVRGFACSIPGCDGRPIEFAHFRDGTGGGMAMKPSDRWGWSACADHHREQHQLGERAFAAKYGLDLRALCETFAKKSPHWPRLRDML